MRVGLVCPYSLDVHGGVQNHVRGLAGALVDLGHEVGVLAPGVDDGRLPAYVTTTGRSVAVPYNGSVARVSFGPLVAARVRRWLTEGRYDVLHIHEPATPSVSVLALWTTEAPVVATFHTAQERPRALGASAATFLRPGLGKISAHVAVSEEARRTVGRYLDADPVVIPNGVHTGRFVGGRRRSGGPVVAFVGRLDEPRKGFDELLAATPTLLRRHPDARLRVLGDGAGPGVLRGLPRSVVRRVELLGPLPDEGKAEVLRTADVVVAPNTHGESFGIVLVEAMAAGAVVAASDLPAFRSVLEEGRLGVLFRPGDAADLARVVGDLLDDPVRRRRLARRARAAASRYDWAQVAPRVADVYRDAAGEVGRRGSRTAYTAARVGT